MPCRHSGPNSNARKGSGDISLSTVVVTNSTETPYKSVLDYASHCQNPNSNLVRHQGSNTLFISPIDDEEIIDHLSDDSDSEAGDSDSDDDYWSPSAINLRRYCGAAGLQKQKVPIPRFCFGLSTTLFHWPPPPHLLAKHLLSIRQASVSRSSPPKISEKMVEEWQNMDKQTIFLSHYTVGAPVATSERVHVLHAVVVAVVGPSDQLRQFLDDVCLWKRTKDGPTTESDRYALLRLKTSNCMTWWNFEGMRRSRPVSSIILPTGDLEAILDDISKFRSKTAVAWYKAHGLPHRRSFLFHGPPGTGKTSMIRLIASTFRLACCYLSMTDRNFSNQGLADAMTKLPNNALLVVEDVDALFNENRDGSGNSLTFSGLLNALDGVMSSNDVITVMTTNHFDRLDSALIRGGRVDRRFFFDFPGSTELGALFKRFYSEATQSEVDGFVEKVLSRKDVEARSIATLQQLFIKNREETPAACVAKFEEFFDTHFPEILRLQREMVAHKEKTLCNDEMNGSESDGTDGDGASC